MKRDLIDYFEVASEHLAIHDQLLNWSRWVRVRPHGWQVSPMFQAYRSNWRQWHVPHLREDTNIPEAVAMEKAVSLLPEKHREAVRWSYVFPGNPAAMARRLGVNLEGLRDLVAVGRSMLKNRSK